VSREYRWTEGLIERAAEIAAEFVRLKVDVIVTSGTPQVIAAKAGDIGHTLQWPGTQSARTSS
jgi:hypothetical protein